MGAAVVVVLITVLIAVVAGVIALFAAGTEVTGTTSGGQVEAAQPAATPEPAAEPVEGLGPGSLIRRAELEKALAALRAEKLGAFVSLRVAPARIDAQLKSRDGRLSILQVTSGPNVNLVTTTGPGFGAAPTLRTRAIDPAAPQRLVRAVLERTRQNADQVDYLVLMGLGQPTWGLFLKDGTHYQGNAAGKILRRVS